MKVMRLLVGLIAAPFATFAADALESGFIHPPDSAKPLTFWQWMNGCMTKEGITSDLESFKRVGLSGTQQFLVGGSEAVLTDPTVEVLNPKWRELMAFAISESARLGLTFGTHNCPGWSASGGPWVRVEDSMQKLVFSQQSLSGPGVLSQSLPRAAVDPKWNYYRDIVVLAFPKGRPCAATEVIDVTRFLDGDDHLQWQAPPGEWTLLRIGHTTTGAINGTAPVSGQGLEVDKMSRSAMERFWSGYPQQILNEAGANAGSALKRFEIDSFEAGMQDWTPEMIAEFTRRRGYNPTPFLPVLAGAVVNDADQSERFHYDWQRTVKDLFAENYFGSLQDLTHRVPGMEFLLEPYATGPHEPFDTTEISGRGDILMCEFWQKPAPWGWDSVKPVASSAHTWGKRLVAAEAFTGQPQYAWRSDPYALKSTGDRAFCLGVNALVLHASAHQPWPGVLPGMTMGWWGTHFGPGQTWWEHGGKEWITYLSRCQFLLQQGIPVGDIAYLVEGRVTPDLPNGYDGDTLGQSELLTRVTVDHGDLVLPDGVRYRILVLPKGTVMTVAVARKLRSLVEAGATIIGSKPTRAPGLQDFPKNDQEVSAIGNEMSADCDGNRAHEHPFGRGKIFCNATAAEVLQRLQVAPDVTQTASPLLWIHRVDKTTDLYFLSNQSDATVRREVSFRIDGRMPELWHPDTGEIEQASEWRIEAARTRVTLSLPPSGSVFVMFRKPIAGADSVVDIQQGGRALLDPEKESARVITSLDGSRHLLAFRNAQYDVTMASGHSYSASIIELPEARTLNSDWNLRFPAGRGAPDLVRLPTLMSWTHHDDFGVRHFSGTATYEHSVEVTSNELKADRRWFLDLGTVKNIAAVRVNGQNLERLWKPPFTVDVTAVLHPGLNSLEIEITNLWPNRMVGDEYEPDDCEWGEVKTFTYVEPHAVIGRPLLREPDWLRAGTPRPSRKRYTFSSFKFFDREFPLLESGLIGPVVLRPAARVKLE